MAELKSPPGWQLFPALLALLAGSAVAQQPYPLGLPPEGARFQEQVRTLITARTPTGDVRRTVLRTTLYTIRALNDTLVIKADSVTLEERGSGPPVAVDTDGFTGGHWKGLLQPDGTLLLLTRPWIPEAVAEVSDLTRAVDDFFPPPPPEVLPGAAEQRGNRRWERQDDSAGKQRYRWHETERLDSVRTVADSLLLELQQTRTESGWMLWDSGRGPQIWHREITTGSSARISNSPVITRVEQQLDIRRLN